MGGAVALAARLVLAGTLAWAAFGKVKARAALPGQIASFGIPAVAVRPLALLLPLAEATLGVALVACPRSSWPAWAALALLAAFTAVVVARLGDPAPCPCFGMSAAPVGPLTLVRNAALVALAVLATGPVDGARPLPVVGLTLGLGAVVVLLVRRAA